MWHVLIAILTQAGFGLTTGNWLAGGLAGVGVFLGREHAQAEYRWIEHRGN